ncbi:AfsR/SARP family transcriptional regulator [Microbispora sp. H10949]|uniref:AfsR/SARP family transcriptional regulator n=1 Tax=Microbispora sp. H10949 TaxID=2729111 RepID=UPI0015FEBAA2|nr:AfsR/SARP family transcriptional regulator [Microbispora sp. H10949]
MMEDTAGQSVDIGNGKLRHLLALFLLNANTCTPKHWLVEHLWHSHAPRSASSNLKTYITRLRRFGVPIATQTDGYVITVAPSQLDADLFENYAIDGRKALNRGDLYEAATALDAATRLWRGDPLHGINLDKELSLWAERLRESFRLVTEDLFEARLSLGRHREIIGPLKTWVAKNPLRERPHAQLMTALYRDGRRADALEVYRDLRNSLVMQVGLEPTSALRELQQQILLEDSRINAESTVHMMMERARTVIYGANSSVPHESKNWNPLRRRLDTG